MPAGLPEERIPTGSRTAKDRVTEEPDLQPVDVRDLLMRDFARDVAAPGRFVQRRQRLGAPERRCVELVLRQHLDRAAREMERRAAVDDQARHDATLTSTRLLP